MWLNLYGHEAVQPKLKKVFLALFWAYVGQPDDHTGWATLMPFASIYSTHPETNPWNFSKKILKIGGFENLILDIFSNISFRFVPMKISQNL